jgi:hypothetical protein
VAVRREFNAIQRNSKHVRKFLPVDTLVGFNLGEKLRIKYTSGIQTVYFCIATPGFVVVNDVLENNVVSLSEGNSED